MKRSILLLSAALLCSGCPQQAPQPGQPEPAAAAKSDAPAAEGDAAQAAPAEPVEFNDHTFAAVCGCELADVGKCSEWVEHEGDLVELKDHGLGSMPFCGKPGSKVKVTGTLQGKTLSASKAELVK